MKVCNEPLHVKSVAGEPVAIIRRRKLRRSLHGRVWRVIDCQTCAVKWWQSPTLQPIVRNYFLVEVQWEDRTTSTLEIYQEQTEWRLSRMSD
jgi:hypothetical protein